MHLDKSMDNVERYKVVKKTAKRAVSETRGRTYDGLYQQLGTKEGEKDIYRMAKSRERKTRDIIQVKCIKDVTERLLTKDEDIKNRWQEYFDNLFNKDSGSSSIELDISSDDLNRQFVHRIQESEVKDALKRMKGGKAMGPDGIPIEVWRTLGDVAIVWLTKLFNIIFHSNKMPDEWRRSILVPIFKNKGMCKVVLIIGDRTNEPYNEAMGEDHWSLFKGSYQRHRKLIWIHGKEIDYGGDFLDKEAYKEM
jgi:hypothetical protein